MVYPEQVKVIGLDNNMVIAFILKCKINGGMVIMVKLMYLSMI